MKHSGHTGSLMMAALAGAMLLTAAPAADAAENDSISSFFFELAQAKSDVFGAEMKKNGGTHEQGVAALVSKDGRDYVVSIYMSPYVSPDHGYWQCKCSSIEMTVDGPKVVVDNVQLTGAAVLLHLSAGMDGDSWRAMAKKMTFKVPEGRGGKIDVVQPDGSTLDSVEAVLFTTQKPRTP